MGKYTPQQYKTFTDAHVKHLLEDWAIKRCPDMHALLEEWSLQQFEDVDPAVWQRRSSICYRLRDMGSKPKPSRSDANQHNTKQHKEADAIRSRTLAANKSIANDKSVADRAIKRFKEKKRGDNTRHRENNPTAGWRPPEFRDAEAGPREWRPGAGKCDSEGDRSTGSPGVRNECDRQASRHADCTSRSNG